MVTRTKPRTDELSDREYFEEDYEATFNKASDTSDNSLLFIGGLIGLTALTDVMGTLSNTERETLQPPTTETITPTLNIPGIGEVSEFMPQADEAIGLVRDAENLAPNEMAHLNQLLEEGRQYGRLSDPKTSENITFNNQSRIADQMGQFGYHEASTQGNLELGGQEGIMFPWVTMGDENVCEDCLAMEAGGPYPANNYPEAQHYGDRCNEPFPDPIILLPGDVEDEDKYSFNEPLPMNLSIRELVDLVKAS